MIRGAPEEALDFIEGLHKDLGIKERVAVLILDFEQCHRVNFSVRETVQMIRNEIINRRIPYTPKIVNLSSNSLKQSKSWLNAQCLDYQIVKPVKKQAVVKMLKQLNLRLAEL